MYRKELLTIKLGTLAIAALSTTGQTIMAHPSTSFSQSQNNAMNTLKLIIEILWSCIVIRAKDEQAQRSVPFSYIWATAKTWTRPYASLATRDSSVVKVSHNPASYAICITLKDFTKSK